MNRKQLLVSSLVVAVIFLVVSDLLADVTATILGTVTDPSGAAVPGATVLLKNADTGLERHTATDFAGYYEFPVVPVGENYRIEVQTSGFEKSVQSGVKLLVGQKYRADFQLRVGRATQTVDVPANAAQVETTSTQLGDVIEDRKITGLPLNGRSYIDLLGLQAGVVPLTSALQFTDRPVSGTGNAGNVSVNGQREAANSFLVNGGDVEEARNNGASIAPTLDSIQEFRVVTNSFDAEYGRFSGAIVNVLTKSGTNQFHGTAYEFLRNDKFDARNFFDLNQTNPVSGEELPGTARGAFKRNQFGGAAGGPISENRIFFFSDYQGTREVRGVSSGNLTVPSLAERQGDFSDVGTTGFHALTGGVRGDDAPGDFAQALSSRLGYAVFSGEPYWFQGCSSTAQCVFPGQVIPKSAWSPAAKATLKFIPLPIGSLGGVPFFSTSAENSRVRDDKFAQRIDLNSQRTGLWSFYYHFDDASVVNPYPAFTSNVPGFPAATPSRAQQANLGNTHIFGPGAVNEVRLNFTRFALIKNQPVGDLGKISDFGFVTGGLGLIPVYPPYEAVPAIGFNLTGIAFGLPDGTTGQFNNTFHLADNLSRVVGQHTLKFGGEARYLQLNERNTYAENGLFGFSGGETGNDFADYLIGAPDSFVQSSRQFLDSRTKYFGIYGQDSYKIKSNVTLNYGLRWEVSQPFYDTQDKIQTVKPGLQSAIYPDAPTGFVYPGDKGIPKTLSPTNYDNFAPRVGIAYSPRFADGALGRIFGGPGKTSIRAAAGLYYTAVEDLTLFYVVGNPPFGLFYVSPTLVYLEEPYKDRLRNNDPGQRFPYAIPPRGANVDFSEVLPISGAEFFNPHNRLPYAEHFNFTIQREIRNSMVLTLGYVGTRGHHLMSTQSFNAGDPARCLQIASLFAAAGQPGAGCGPFGEDSIYQINGQTFNGTRPFSVTSGRSLGQGRLDFAENEYFTTISNSNYNALQISLEKRLGALRLLGAYTWSKSLDNGSALLDFINPYSAHTSKALSAFDLTHSFVASYSYDLPLLRLAASQRGVTRKLLEGWQLTGITRFATGLPILLTQSGDLSLCGCPGADLPNYSGAPVQFFNPRASANHQYVSPSPFSSEVLGTRGNSNREFFHGPGLNNWDFALHKDTHITDTVSAEFRAEFFNLFNHAQFLNPSGDFASTTFGRVTGARDPRIGQMALKFYF